MPEMSGKSVAVVGGGIGGLTTALAFALTGAKVVVYEQAAEISEVGAGLQITPNGARALIALGLGSALSTQDHELGTLGIAAQAVQPTDGLTGRKVARFDLSDQVPAYRFLHRAELITALYSKCLEHGVVVQTGHRVGDTLPEADLGVGADGVRSVLRPHLNGAAKAKFTGQVAWRAIVTANHAPEAHIWMLPGRHVVTYPLSMGRVNIVAVEEREDWAEEGWHHADDPANLREAFADAAPELQELLKKIETTNLWGLFRHDVAANWHKGCVALVGDAAHPTLPFLAQGANLAIEDGYVMAQAVQHAETMEAGLAHYQALRKPRVSRAIAAANANAVNYHLSGIRRSVAHKGLGVLGAVAPKAFLNRLSWLYDHDVTQLWDAGYES